MLQPTELKLNLPMVLSNNVVSTTTKVWNILVASKRGDLETVKRMADECHELLYAQYNYTPPVHFAVREGHIDLVRYLLQNGAHDPKYKIYPFQESLQTIVNDRGRNDIESLLNEYAANPALQKYRGDNGEIQYNRTELEQEFEHAVNKNGYNKAESVLKEHPEFAKDETYFWGEGIMVFAAKENNQKMMELLMSYGAKVPTILKWAQFYYFERYDSAAYLMEKGMNPNVMSWHHVTLLHDMAQKGEIQKAELLIKYGAYIDPVDEEYQSTPLGMAARWGQAEMVEYLISQGADPNKSGAPWSSPLSWARMKGHGEIEKILLKHSK
ncbi:MAG TPA: ankyrin repeat domain-containing protein [Chitinophagaceae bacterium]|nr:ankyrin repeat domain-containing protein [Chitinophagaceae bacterium]